MCFLSSSDAAPLINPLSSIIRKIALLYNRAAGSVRVYGEVCVWKETSLYSRCTPYKKWMHLCLFHSFCSLFFFSERVYRGKKVYSCLLLASNFLFLPRTDFSIYSSRDENFTCGDKKCCMKIFVNAPFCMYRLYALSVL